MKIVIGGGGWGTNIGNAFMQIGAEYIVRRIFNSPDDIILTVYDRPKYNNLLHNKKFIPECSFDYIKNLDIDYFIMIGPTSIKYFVEAWQDTIDKIINRGGKYIYLGAGMMRYDNDSIEEVREFFKKYQPVCMTTRDRITYEAFKDCVKNIYDGIDLAFFTSSACKSINLLNKSIVSNFDKINEPIIIEWNEQQSAKSLKIKLDDNKSLGLSFSSIFTKAGLITDRRTDAIIYLLSFLPKSKRSQKIYEYDIIRTDHRTNPLFIRKAYRYNNSYCADIPWPYINLYANSTLTLTDRVHACVVTLAFGNPAMLFSQSKRNALLDRVGAEDISNNPVTISTEYLNNEKEALISYLKQVLNY